MTGVQTCALPICSLRAAYNAIPKHLRIYVLGDMDYKDSAILTCIEDTEVSEEMLESFKTDYEGIWERLN